MVKILPYMTQYRKYSAPDDSRESSSSSKASKLKLQPQAPRWGFGTSTQAESPHFVPELRELRLRLEAVRKDEAGRIRESFPCI
jgi:hypothetical protein